MADDSSDSKWMDEQAAEYADLVGSFVESVHDQETDEMLEYQLIWEGGDLGVALTPLDNSETGGVMVSRITGKGFPFGIKNVGPGDVLLSINLRDTSAQTLDQVVAYLQECDLPATLRFKKVSPDMDRVGMTASTPAPVPAAAARKRLTNVVVTGNDGPTSPTGSRAPPAIAGSSRMSQKALMAAAATASVAAAAAAAEQQQQYQQQQQQHGMHRGYASANSRLSMQVQSSQAKVAPPQYGRASQPALARPSSSPQVTMPPPPPPAAAATTTTAAVASPTVKAASRPASQPLPVDQPKAKTKAKTKTKTEPTPAPAPSSKPKANRTPAPAPVPAPEPVPVPEPAPASPPASPRGTAIPTTMPLAAAFADRDTVESVDPDEARAEWARHSEDEEEEDEDEDGDVDAARDQHLGETKARRPSLAQAAAAQQALEQQAMDDELSAIQRGHAQSVAMLGDYSTETSGIPILPENSMSVINSIDGVFLDPRLHNSATHPQQYEDESKSESEVERASAASSSSSVAMPVIKPSLSGKSLRRREEEEDQTHLRMTQPRSPVSVDGSLAPSNSSRTSQPRASVHLTVDGGVRASAMRSQPIGTIHELCAKGNARGAMQYLKVNGPEELIDRESNHGQTCLHLAVKSGNAPLVKHILELYEPVEELVNVEDDKGNTALHFAATKTPGVVHLLLESGASANVKNSRKLTPLIISVITSRDDSVIIPRMLLKYGANPNDLHESQTVIHTAIGSNRLQIAGALVRAGAKMDVEDSEGKNVFEKLNRKSIRFLLTHIYFPPTYITEKERSDCMLCQKKLKFGHRKCNCTHCGRLACAECCSLTVEMYKFPMGFPGRVHKGAAVRDLKRVCKSCYAGFKERGDTPQKEESRFLNRVIGVEWDEVNPNKLQATRAAGRRGNPMA